MDKVKTVPQQNCGNGDINLSALNSILIHVPIYPLVISHWKIKTKQTNQKPHKQTRKPTGLVVYSFNPSTQETETGLSPSSRPSEAA